MAFWELLLGSVVGAADSYFIWGYFKGKSSKVRCQGRKLLWCGWLSGRGPISGKEADIREGVDIREEGNIEWEQVSAGVGGCQLGIVVVVKAVVKDQLSGE